MSRTYWRLVAWASTVGVLLLCFLPSDNVPTPEVQNMDKLFHALAFFIVGFAWVRSGRSWKWALVIGLLLAAGTEVGQRLLQNGRHGDPIDFAADMAGVLLGVLVARRVRPPR